MITMPDRSHESPGVASPSLVLTRAQLSEQISQRLAGQQSDDRLAKWAFDHFYKLELEQEACEPGAEDLIAEVLDALMFGDEPGFQLQEEELRALAARLAGV